LNRNDIRSRLFSRIILKVIGARPDLRVRYVKVKLSFSRKKLDFSFGFLSTEQMGQTSIAEFTDPVPELKPALKKIALQKG
jgi:hypothetical protein